MVEPGGGLIERLSRAGVFARLTRHEIAALLASGRLLRVGAGSQLIAQGETNRDYLVLLEGELEVRRAWIGADGRQQVSLGHVRPGEGVGEMAVLSAVPRGASVAAVRDSRLLRIDGDEIDELLSWSAQLAESLRENAEARRRASAVRAAPVFRRLPLPVMQSAFARMCRMEVAAGTEVVRQGDPGDSYYLIEAGRAEVVRNGLFVAELGGGATFGEEALLTGAPRNATVRMAGAGVLWRLDKAEFDSLLRTALIETATPEEAVERVRAGAGRWLDVRTEDEHAEAHIPGAQSLPLARLRTDALQLDRHQTYYVYCRGDLLSACAVFLLRERGFHAVALTGGIIGWPYELV